MASRAFMVFPSLPRPVSNILNVPCSSVSTCVSSSPSRHCPMSKLFPRSAHVPTLPVHVCLPSITVCVPTSPVSLLSWFDLSAIPLALLLPGRYAVSSLCISRACPMSGFSGHRMGGAKEKGFSGLCICILGKGHQLALSVTPARWHL